MGPRAKDSSPPPFPHGPRGPPARSRTNPGPAARRTRADAASDASPPTSGRRRADPNAPPKVNAWEAPTNVAAWKEEHIVLAVLGGWAVVIKGAMATFGGKK